MKKLILEILIVILVYGAVVGSTNYNIDVAHVFNNEEIEEMAQSLKRGENVIKYGDEDEGRLHELMVSELKEKPEALIVGASTVMYIPFEDAEEWRLYNCGESGSYLGDIYGQIGLFDYYGMLPDKIIIGVDPKLFRADIESMIFTSLDIYRDYEATIVGTKQGSFSKIKNSEFMKKTKELFSPSYFQSCIKSKGQKDESDSQDRGDTHENSYYVWIRPNGQKILGTETLCSSDKILEDTEHYIYVEPRYYSWLIERGYMSDNNDETIPPRESFERLIDSLLERNVDVQIYLPTWNPVMYEYCSNSEYSGGIEVEKYIRGLAEERNIIVRGTYNPNALDIGIDDFWDWQHMSPDNMLYTFEYIEEE